MTIENKDRFPDVDFLPDSQIHTVGDVGGTPLVILGFEKGTKVAVVSKSYDGEDFFAVPLYELMSHSQDPVNITEKLD